MLPLAFLIYRLFAIRRVLAMSATTAATRHRVGRVSRTLNVVLIVWGAAVLALHSHASLVVWTRRDAGCLLDMRPWARASYTCAVLELSCSQRRVDGYAHEIDAALRRVDRATLQSLVVSNCPALEIPAIVDAATDDAFRSLIMLKLFNSTIVRWDVDAALDAARFPTLQQLLLIDCNMTAFPHALTTAAAPSSLRDIKIVGSNLTTLPMELATAWRAVTFLALERHPQLTVVPRVVGQLRRLVYLSLHGNALDASTAFPASVLDDAALFQLVLSNNSAFSELPTSLGRWQTFRAVDISFTNVSTLPPAWLAMRTAAGGERWDVSELISVRASATPLCARLAPRTVVMQSRFVVQCDAAAANTDYTYPIEQEGHWRQANRA
ncbi:hypothetical protein PINS_up007063 [Pythium insidiosum]|nr:hypothetical protein PINS_up007063 [Pythium insidiosum]